ncbi:tetratricopeptide repeat protein [Ramlibacter sp. XY19]|uniref:tetratricopeptide repeat protein n=1 Tax=Ramlibacter paludis TaxID=2908000 RepID=UPI0023DA5FE4|nr:tetratricopeptide repeat protein [Ramlibacter paludis]MCG2591782.1 tetratricopeptide repeat protein [Ramlibacter paludis]
MKRFPRAAAAAILVLSGVCAPAFSQDDPPPADSGLDAALFYQLLLGELNVRGEEPGAGFALILDAARKTNDPELYQRAVELAFQARSGDAALQAARDWKKAFPQSREANRYVLQVLVALNRMGEIAEPLRAEIALADAKDRAAVINALPRNFARVTDKKLAATSVEQALSDYTAKTDLGPAAWTTIGRMRLAAGDTAGALEAARRGQTLDARYEGPPLLALELMDPKMPEAEAMVRKYLDANPLPEIRMGYARALLDAQRYPEALQQLKAITTERPEFAEAWLVQGTLMVQDNQLPAGEVALKRYIELAQKQEGDERKRGLAQAYLSLSQVAEKRKDYAGAAAWLDRIDDPQDLMAAQNRRASILARQGRIEEARKLIRAIPERKAGDARLKMMSEISLLRDHKQYKAAYQLLAQAVAKEPKDPDLLYDQAMMAEKLNDFTDMEKLLRQVMVLKPDYHHAYNALGYSLAERNVRLPEARQLVLKALDFAPGDPFISDSLAWVEFRMGNKEESLRLLQAAWKDKPDPEIAAHLGEVLWSMGRRDQAEKVWREGLALNAENDTLVETLKRLKVKP